MSARYCIFPSRSSKEDLSCFPGISVEVEFRDLMTEYFEARITDKTKPEASTGNRAKALFRYLVVKEPKNEAKNEAKTIGTAALRCYLYTLALSQ